MKFGRKFTWVLLPALLMAAGAVLAKPPQAISECETFITEPGKYQVVNDLECADGKMGVWILASDVMLDLRGHTISCETPARSGVIVGDAGDPEVFSNVRISNGTVTGCGNGVLLWFTDSARVTKMSLIVNAEGGVTLVEGQNNVIKKNLFEGRRESFGAVLSYKGTGNWIGHNTYYSTYVGIDLYGEADSRITCNTASDNFYTFGLNPWGATPSSGNLVRGNDFIGNFFGISLIGVGEPPDTVWEPMSTDNLVHANIVGGYILDMSEAFYAPPPINDLFLIPDAECKNMWKNNMFGTQYGPEDCIGTPVVLEDVCAMDDD